MFLSKSKLLVFKQLFSFLKCVVPLETSFFECIDTDPLTQVFGLIGKLTEENMGRVFNSRFGCVLLCHAVTLETKTTKLKVENLGKQLLGSFPLAFALQTLIMLIVAWTSFQSGSGIVIVVIP
jgi:hypothetical protein